MLRLLMAVMIMILLAGCFGKRVPQFAPRQTPSPEHLAAAKNDDCRSCHDLKPLRHHSPQDDCLRCHHLCKECPQ